MEKPKYLALEYGKIRNPLCNVHKSQGTLPATRLHYHDFYQIYFLIKGSLIHHVADAESVLYSGDCFILPPDTPHRIEKTGADTLFYSFSFREEFLPRELNASFLTIARLGKTLDSKTLIRAEKLLSCALEEFEAQQPGWEAALRGLLAAILVLLSRTEETEKARRQEDAIAECIQFIQENLGSSLLLADLQKQYHLSASTFYRQFRRRTGENFREYVLGKRIERACMLLRQTRLPVCQVAAQCGFGNYAGFYRAFRERTGISPKEYRCSGTLHERGAQ